MALVVYHRPQLLPSSTSPFAAAFFLFTKDLPLTYLNLTMVPSPRVKKKKKKIRDFKPSNKGVIQNLAVCVEKVSDSNDWVTNPFQFLAFNKTEEGSNGVVSW